MHEDFFAGVGGGAGGAAPMRRRWVAASGMRAKCAASVHTCEVTAVLQGAEAERVAQRPCSAGAAEGGTRAGGACARRALSVRTAGSSPAGSASPDTAASVPLAWRPGSPARLGVICRICEEPVRGRNHLSTSHCSGLMLGFEACLLDP